MLTPNRKDAIFKLSAATQLLTTLSFHFNVNNNSF